jgi:PDZ domain
MSVVHLVFDQKEKTMRTSVIAIGLCLGLIAGLQSNVHGQGGDAKPAAAKKALEPKVNQNLVIQGQPDAEYVWTMGVPESNSLLLNWSRCLGADLAAADAPLRAQLKLNDGEGYVVVGVKPDGAGAEAGVQLYDVLLGLNDEPKPEAAYPVQVWRRGAKQPLTVKVKSDRQWWIGVNLAEIDEAMRSQLSLTEGRGLLVQEVTDNSPAKQSGLQKFDVIDGWGDGTASGSVEEFSRTIQKSDGKTLTVQILRHGKSLSISITPQKRPSEAASAIWQADAARLLFSRVQPQWTVAPTNPRMAYLDFINTAQQQQPLRYITVAPAADRHSKLAAVEKQLDQLLKEVQAARQTIEELRKLEDQSKEKPVDEKK